MVTLPPDTFLGAFGFTENPFLMTNADDEPDLQSYFVPPPYFASVLGDPKRAKSAVVFAPRGGGKTAQKVMIEKASNDPSARPFLCITYDSFLLPEAFKLAAASSEWHLTNICKLVSVALLVQVSSRDDEDIQLSADQKNTLAKIAVTFLSQMTESEFRERITSLRNWSGKVSHVWDKYGGKISNLLTAVAARFNIGSLDKLAVREKLNRNTIVDYIKQLSSISKSLGFESIYILVDRVDETALTSNNAKAAYEFIASLLTDLHVLELDGFAFKFFLWDQSKQFYVESGARPDRVPIHQLEWTLSQLGQMLARRLSTFSRGSVSSLNELASNAGKLNLHDLVCFFAFGSPRDMIRICQRLVDEQTRTNDQPGKIEPPIVERALRNFSQERSEELYPAFISDIKKVGDATFTIAKISADVFRFTAQAGRNKVRNWQDAGAVFQSGELPSPGNRPSNLYSIRDPRLVLVAKGNKPLEEILLGCFGRCTNCGTISTTESDAINCSQCEQPLAAGDNLLEQLKIEVAS